MDQPLFEYLHPDVFLYYASHGEESDQDFSIGGFGLGPFGLTPFGG